MSKFWLSILLALCCGTTCAWAINHYRYGRRTTWFGPFSMTNDVTPDNVMEALSANVPPSLGRVEMPEGSNHNFGAMSPGDSGEHSFVVRNVGTGELKLRIGASTCKCTIGTLDKKALGPGEETEVTLSWEITKGSHSTAFSQSAQLITDDPGKVAINLNITGKVISDIQITPEQLSFGEVAAGEPFEFKATVYNFMDTPIQPTKQMFSDDKINDKATFAVEEIEISDGDGIYAEARQAFEVTVNVEAGLRQGAVSQNFLFGFRTLDENGEFVEAESPDVDPNRYAITSVTGRIVGALGMIPGARIKGTSGGVYIYDFGRIEEGDSLVGKAFVVLKGSERDKTKLRIGETTPNGVLKAKLGDPITGRGTMVLFPLEIEVVPGDEKVAKLGLHRDDYGSIWIESDNPKVTKMRVAVKFSVDAR